MVQYNSDGLVQERCNSSALASTITGVRLGHDDVMTWKHFPCYWPFVRGIHQSPVDSPQKGHVTQAVMFSLMLA